MPRARKRSARTNARGCLKIEGNGSEGGTRTLDTRIMMQRLLQQLQRLSETKSVKPPSEDQIVSRNLSSRIAHKYAGLVRSRFGWRCVLSRNLAAIIRLVGAFRHVYFAIDYLKVWYAPIV